MSIRQEKVAREIQRDLSVIMNRMAPRFLGRELVTVVDVDVSPDLSIAKVYLGIMNAVDKQKSVGILEFHAKEIRREFATGAGKSMRKIPEFRFYLDTGMDHAERIEKLLNNLKDKP